MQVSGSGNTLLRYLCGQEATTQNEEPIVSKQKTSESKETASKETSTDKPENNNNREDTTNTASTGIDDKTAISLKKYYTGLEESNQQYESIRKAAQALRGSAEKLVDQGKDSLFAKAAESGDTKEVVGEVLNFIKEYNNMVQNMDHTDDSTSKMLLRKFQNTSSIQKEALNQIGISVSKDGMLQVDESKLKAAKLEDLQDVFSGDRSFAGKVLERSKVAEENAVETKQRQTVILSSYTKSGLYGDSNDSLSSILGNYFNSKS